MRLHKRYLHTILASALVLALTALPSISIAKVYSWTDDQGKKHFTSNPAKVPRKYREKPKKPNFRDTDMGWQCAKPIDPKTQKQLMKTENNMHLWEKENVRNHKHIKRLEEKRAQLLTKGKSAEKEEGNIRQFEERIEFLEDQIKLTKNLLKVDKKKYICK